ncbi:MAG: HTTM domain-containing protein [Myxococcales bacterium]|nr:MAG: HTTM domain-containing protein [Myxococcales bacterium]
MKGFEFYFWRDQAASRIAVLLRSLYALLAFDAWLLMLPHAGRYGAGGFNVAHFVWLDRLQPMPNPFFYSGLIVCVGLLALFCALGPSRAWLRALLFVLYSYAWLLSLLDSYQHHYFLSLALFCFVFVPDDALSPKSGIKIEAWAFQLFILTVALLYGFAVIPKLESGWREGQSLYLLLHRRADNWLWLLQGKLGDNVWRLSAGIVIAMEAVLSLAYMTMPWLGRTIALGAWCIAIALHLGAETLGLRIGWFSIYMMLIATVVFWPTWLWDGLIQFVIKNKQRFRKPAWAPVIFVVFSFVSIALLVGLQLDGALYGVVFFVGCVLVQSVNAYRISGWRVAFSTLALLSFSVFVFAGSIQLSDVRYDYYRFIAGDLKRRGQIESALSAYQKAEHFAPSGKSRKGQIEKLKKLSQNRNQ